MRKLLLLSLLAITVTATAFAQSPNPYKRFGYKVKNDYVMTVKGYTLENRDTASPVSKIFIDSKTRVVYVYSKNEQLIGKFTLSKQEFLRFLSLDPLTQKYPGLTPYQFGSDRPIDGVDLDGLEYSPAGKIGIFARDATAVQLYPQHPAVIEIQKQNAPFVRMQHMVGRANSNQPATFSQYRKLDLYQQQQQEIMRRQFYEENGYNEDGSKPPLMRLAENKTWNAFANNIALPALDVVAYSDGYGELEVLLKGGRKAEFFLLRKELNAAEKAGAEIDVLNGKFAQPNHSNEFSKWGKVELGIDNIPQAVSNLKSGKWTAVNLPIDYVVRNGQVYYLNTRSIASLTEAGIPKSQWIFRNRTGVELFEKNLTENLNGSSGYLQVRNRKTGKITKLR